MRLIDADALKAGICAECTLHPDRCLKDNCDWASIYHIDNAPTIDAVPKHQLPIELVSAVVALLVFAVMVKR